MIYGYCRCSTNATRQDINRQIRELKTLGVSIENIYKEYVSASKKDRIELNRLLKVVTPGDTIIATEVSRITRSTTELCNLISFAKEKHLKLILGTFVLDCTKEPIDPMAQGMLQLMGVFAELERNIISARVKSGMENAKEKGKRIGRPPSTTVPKKILSLYDLYKEGRVNKKDYAIMANVSRPTLDKYLKILETCEDQKQE